MKMRHSAAIVMILCMLVSSACADSVLDSFGNWLDRVAEDPEKVLEDASEWAEGAWKDASEWAEDAWGDASVWIDQAWGGASEWVTDIWGNVSDWAAEAYDSAGVWWDETFDKVTRAADSAWEWIENDPEGIRDQISEKLHEIVAAGQEGALEVGKRLREVYEELLEQLNIHGEDISKVMESIKAYAAEKGISVSAMEEVMLPYLVQLADDAKSLGNTEIPPVAVVQYLTGIIEKEAVETEEQARQLIESLEDFGDKK